MTKVDWFYAIERYFPGRVVTTTTHAATCQSWPNLSKMITQKKDKTTLVQYSAYHVKNEMLNWRQCLLNNINMTLFVLNVNKDRWKL
jgi:acetone carboxylase gamma subunit